MSLAVLYLLLHESFRLVTTSIAVRIRNESRLCPQYMDGLPLDMSTASNALRVSEKNSIH